MAYSFNELKELREQTICEIGRIIKDETSRNGAMTARDLADATGGLCSAHHIANKISYDGYGYCASDRDYKVRVRPITVRKIQHMAELDDNGQIIRRFDWHSKSEVNTYEVV